MTRRLSRSRVQQAAELARALNLKALEVRADGSFRVELAGNDSEGSALERWRKRQSA